MRSIEPGMNVIAKMTGSNAPTNDMPVKKPFKKKKKLNFIKGT